MKKRTLYLLLLLFSLFLFGCGNDDLNLGSEKGQSCAKQAIDAVTEYLDGSYSYDRTYNTLGELCNEMKYASNEKDADNNPNHLADFGIYIKILGMQNDLLHDNTTNNAESYNQLKNDIEELQIQIDN